MSSANASEYDQWTSDATELDTTYYWGTDGQGASSAAAVGLTNTSQLTPKLIKKRSSGGDAYIFTYANKCYLWNMIADQIFEYTEPTGGYDAVVTEMKKPHGSGKTKMKLVQQK